MRNDIFGGITAAVVAVPLALAFGVASGDVMAETSVCAAHKKVQLEHRPGSSRAVRALTFWILNLQLIAAQVCSHRHLLVPQILFDITVGAVLLRTRQDSLTGLSAIGQIYNERSLKKVELVQAWGHLLGCMAPFLWASLLRFWEARPARQVSSHSETYIPACALWLSDDQDPLQDCTNMLVHIRCIHDIAEAICACAHEPIVQHQRQL